MRANELAPSAHHDHYLSARLDDHATAFIGLNLCFLTKVGFFQFVADFCLLFVFEC